jgi:thiol-disulfide isomerase/thioredoxin
MKTPIRIAAALAALVFVSTLSLAVMKPGEKLIPFSLKNVDGKDYTVTVEGGKLTLTVTEMVAGQAKTTVTHPAGILIDFWATWCVPCRKAMPHMQQLNETYKPAEGQAAGGLRVFGIALDDAGGKVVKPFYTKLKITYPMLADAPSVPAAAGVAATAKDMKKAYGVQEIPVVYLIDSTGTITHAHVGFKEEHIAELDAAVKAILAGATR